MYNVLGLCIIFSGLCIVCWGFVLSVGALYNLLGLPPLPIGARGGMGVAGGGQHTCHINFIYAALHIANKIRWQVNTSTTYLIVTVSN